MIIHVHSTTNCSELRNFVCVPFFRVYFHPLSLPLRDPPTYRPLFRRATPPFSRLTYPWPRVFAQLFKFPVADCLRGSAPSFSLVFFFHGTIKRTREQAAHHAMLPPRYDDAAMHGVYSKTLHLSARMSISHRDRIRGNSSLENSLAPMVSRLSTDRMYNPRSFVKT